MATKEQLKSLPSVPIGEVEAFIPLREKTNRNPRPNADASGSDSDAEDHSLKEYLDSLKARTVEDLENKQKKILAKYIQREKDRKDYRCMFVNSRTKVRCPETKYEDSEYCRDHKGYMKKKEKSRDVRKMLSDVAKEKQELSAFARELKQKDAILEEHREFAKKLKEMRPMNNKVFDSNLQFQLDTSKHLTERLFEDSDSGEEKKSKKTKKQKTKGTKKDSDSGEEKKSKKTKKQKTKGTKKDSEDLEKEIFEPEEVKLKRKKSSKKNEPSKKSKISTAPKKPATHGKFEIDNQYVSGEEFPLDSASDSLTNALSGISISPIEDLTNNNSD